MQYAADYYRDFQRLRKKGQSPMDMIFDTLQTQALETYTDAGEVVAQKKEADFDESLSVIFTSVSFITTIIQTMVSAAVSLGAFLFRLNPYVLGLFGIAALGGGMYAYLTRDEEGEEGSNTFLSNWSYGEGTYAAPTPPPSPRDMTMTIRKRQSAIKSIVAGAEAVGMDTKTMLGIAKAESAFGKYTHNSASSAQGMFQILPSTWNQYYPRFAQKYGIPRNDPNDPESASIFSAAYAKEVLLPKIESVKGSKGNAADLYMMYVFGPAGGAALIREYAKDPTRYSVIEHSKRSYGPSQINANPTFFYNENGRPKTLAETFALARSKVTLTETEKIELKPFVKERPVFEEEPEPEIPSMRGAGGVLNNQNFEIVRNSDGRLVKVML